MVFADIVPRLEGWIPVFVLLFSALIMAVCGLFIKYHLKWLEDYALPFSILGAMAFFDLHHGCRIRRRFLMNKQQMMNSKKIIKETTSMTSMCLDGFGCFQRLP